MSNFNMEAVIKPIDLSGKSSFDAEDIKQPTHYKGLKWDVKYKEAHTWSLDTSLSIFLDKTLTGIMAFPYGSPPEGTKRARDLFRAYATKDSTEWSEEMPPEEMFPFERTDSEEYAELQWALGWLKDNFTRLWT